jgi:hypothetical protein
MVNKIAVAALLFCLLSATNALAQGEVCAYLFYGSGCPHCANAISYIEGNHPELELQQINIATEYELIMGCTTNTAFLTARGGWFRYFS